MSEEKIVIYKRDYYKLIDEINMLYSRWNQLDEYVDLKIEINPSNWQYKNIRHKMDYIKGGMVE